MGSFSYYVQGFTGFLNHQLYWAMVEGSCERICSKTILENLSDNYIYIYSLEGLTSMHFDVAWESWLDSCGEVRRFRHLATELPTNMSLKLPWSWPLSATTMVDQVLLNTCKVYDHTRKHTWDLKTDPQKTRFLFDIMIFKVQYSIWSVYHSIFSKRLPIRGWNDGHHSHVQVTTLARCVLACLWLGTKYPKR